MNPENNYPTPNAIKFLIATTRYKEYRFTQFTSTEICYRWTVYTIRDEITGKTEYRMYHTRGIDYSKVVA